MAACVSPFNVAGKETWPRQQSDESPMLTDDTEFDPMIFTPLLEIGLGQDIEGINLTEYDDCCGMLIDYYPPCGNCNICDPSSNYWRDQRSDSSYGHSCDSGFINHDMMLEDMPQPVPDRSCEGNDVLDMDFTHHGLSLSVLMKGPSDASMFQDFSFDPQRFLNSFQDVSEDLYSSCPVHLPQEMQKKKNVTLVLDLDETLIHSSMEPCKDADFSFQVKLDTKEHTVYVRRRPHLAEFLQRVSNLFQVFIFTAGQSIYADKILDILDPAQSIFSRRLYRESCKFSDGSYIKDLTIIGVDLAKVVIVDNTPQVFKLQVNNGIPIKSWFDDPSDGELLNLLPFFETLVDVDDVRPIVSERFKKV